MVDKIKKNNNIIIYAIMLIIFFEPQIFKEDSFELASNFDYVYKIAKIICFIITTFLYFKTNRIKISKLLIAITTLQIVMLISTLIYDGDLIRFIGPAITTVTMCMIAEILIKKDILFSTLKIVNKYFVICFILNLISIILIDFTDFNNFTRIYFMGIDNRFIFTLLPWILFEGLVSIKECNKLNTRWKIVFLVSELLLIYKFSVAAMICMSFYIFSLFGNRRTISHKNTIFIGYILANISIIFFKIQRFFVNVLGFLGKDSTFAGRTYIWDSIIQLFYQYPIIGYGMHSIDYDKNFFFNSTAPYYLEFCRVSHAHNSLMTMLYRGGILSVIIYLAIIYKAIEQLVTNFANRYAKILKITLIIILVASIFDTMDFAALYFIITLIINIKEFDKEEC